MSTAVAKLVADTPRLNVPNHLLDTQLFPSHATLSNVLATDKQSLHFKGFQLGKVHRQKVSLTNKANGARRFHVLSPASGFFKIRFKKTGKLTPGMSLGITVEFCTNEFNYYEDFIKIHCEGGNNLVIPLHAYPVLDMSSFPKQLSFSNTPVCKSVFKKIKLTSPVPVDFLFRLHYTGHPSLSVVPSSGIIPGEGSVELKVTFCPTEYITASGAFDLVIQQYDNPVYRCAVMGLSQPGAERDIVLESESVAMPSLTNVRRKQKLTDPLMLDPSTLAPVKQSRKGRKRLAPKPVTSTVVDGVRFPDNLNNPTAVAFVLNQKPGHLKASELKTGSAAAEIAKQIGNERQLKSAVFESLVKQKALEERNNRLRWTTQLGSDPMSPEQQSDVVEERERAQQDYLLTQAVFSHEDEFSQTKTHCSAARVYRLANEHTKLLPTFDPYMSSEWGKRKLALTRFIRAVRKVIVTQRVAKRFQMLIKHHVKNVRHTPDTPDTSQCTDNMGEVTPVYLPLYHQERDDVDMTPAKLGDIPSPAISLQLEVVNPIFNLHVPRSSDLLEYREHEISLAASHEPEVPIIAVGAEDELTPVLPESDTLVTETLSFPPEINFPTNYPPLMIFNPAPGVTAQYGGTQCLETSEEYYLNPLLRRPIRHRGPIQPLHKQDVIPGTQRWHKFPCQMLVSVNNMSTIGSVWCPRREGLLQDPIPELMTELTPDLEIGEDEEVGALIHPTPESVAEQFLLQFEKEEDPLPHMYTSHDINGPIHRLTREEQLAEFDLERQNKLGKTIHRKLDTLQDHIRNKDLHLDV
ncbi:cilia- and flagella-associated protein 221-like [Bolinopsis microptera]|uniref:cilia- and flagella-associated protein 221-like n=1 Tax=Bolinopsis microptera TaxID=2820187 RepID=UPI00307980F5